MLFMKKVPPTKQEDEMLNLIAIFQPFSSKERRWDPKAYKVI